MPDGPSKNFTTADVARSSVLNALQAAFPHLEASLQAALCDRGTLRDLKRGERLFSKGDPTGPAYVVVQGRLVIWSGAQASDGRRLGTAMPGQTVGEIGLLTGALRSAHVSAARPTVAVAITQEDFEQFVGQDAPTMLRVAKDLSQRLSASTHGTPPPSPQTIAIHQHPSVTDSDFDLLLDALSDAHQIDSAAVSAWFPNVDGALPVDAEARDVVGRRLAEREQATTRLFLVVRRGEEQWARLASARADNLVHVITPHAEPSDAPAARPSSLDGVSHRTVVLVWPAGTTPSHTRRRVDAWQAQRWVHVREGSPASMQRAARRLIGRSAGLALSGGGARGFAHIGVLTALTEAGVVFDHVSGTSMGGIVAAVWGRTEDPAALLEAARDMVRRRPFHEYTLPLFSLLGTRRLDAIAEDQFGTLEMEDLWPDTCLIACDLTRRQRLVMDSGSAKVAVRATAAIPGLILPVLHEDRVLVDGGLLDDLPGTATRQRGAQRVVGVQVASSRDLVSQATQFPSPWRALGGWLRRRSFGGVPTIADVLLQTASIGSAAAAEAAGSAVDVMIHPKTSGIPILALDRIDDLVEAGRVETLRAMDAGELTEVVEMLTGTPHP